MLSITGSGQLNSYMFKEVYQNTSVMTISSLLSLPVMFIAFPLVPKLVKKFGKKNVILASAAFGLVINLFKVFVYIDNVYVYIGLNLLQMIGQTAFTMLIWALVSDCLRL